MFLLNQNHFIKIWFFFVFKLIACNNTVFVEIVPKTTLGFSNQVIFFKFLMHHMLSSKISSKRFFILGPFSGHIGMFRNNCNLQNFFQLKHLCNRNVRVKTRWDDEVVLKYSVNQSSCNKILNFLKGVNFIGKNLSLSVSKYTSFIKFKQEYNESFSKARKSIHRYINEENIFNIIKFQPESILKFYPNIWDKHIDYNFFDFFYIKNDISLLTSKLIFKLFKNESYDSMHIRLKDFKYYCQNKKGCYYSKNDYILAIKNFQKKNAKNSSYSLMKIFPNQLLLNL